MDHEVNKLTIEQKIEMYIEGRLNEEESDLLWAEMMNRPDYYDYFKTVVNLKHIVKDTDLVETGRYQSRKDHFYRVAIAAAVVITIGILGYLNVNLHISATPPTALHQLAMQTTRSAVTMDGSMESDIQRGINLANLGKTTQAISLFKKILEENADPQVRALALTNLGIMYYNQVQIDKAINAFSQIPQQQGLDVLTYEKAYWYLGNAYLKEGQLKEARSAIKKAYDLNGAYRRVTEEYLKKLDAVLDQKS
ncbi:MAG TPA: tetratricopeptide repeat protein [Balneolales bacterium]|nr:tetratricopeptide repeat protein [Balneolales bacterium]